MKTGNRKEGSAELRIRQCSAFPPHMRERTRELCNLEVPADEQNKGAATALMHKVCHEADEAGMTLVVFVNPFGDNIALSRTQLREWYAKRFGFQVIQDDPCLMARLPGSTPPVMKLNPITKELYTVSRYAEEHVPQIALS
jgi:N-acetylglutamate synthase-like GNAT family acetyltransferase